MDKVGLTVGESAKEEARRRDSERVKQAEKRVQDRHKKNRVTRSQAKQHNENLRICREGVTYEAGAFGGLEPCNEPKRKKKAKKTKKRLWTYPIEHIFANILCFVWKSNLKTCFQALLTLNYTF